MDEKMLEEMELEKGSLDEEEGQVLLDEKELEENGVEDEGKTEVVTVWTMKILSTYSVYVVILQQ